MKNRKRDKPKSIVQKAMNTTRNRLNKGKFDKDSFEVVPLIIETDKIDDFKRSQMWDCESSEQILNDCKYQVFATDMLAATLHYKERAELDMDFLEALVEMFPQCKAVYFQNSGKLFTAIIVFLVTADFFILQ